MAVKKEPINIVYLQYIMERQGWSNKALAEEIGVDKTTLFNWKKGKNQPTTENVNKLAKALRVDRQVLLDDDAAFAQKFLRKIVYETCSQPVVPVEPKVLLQILKALGILDTSEKLIVQMEPPTEAEKQRIGLMNETTKGHNNSDTK